MEFPQIGTPLGFFLIICCLWIWTLRKGKAHLFQQELVLRDQNRSASWAFLTCSILQVFVPLFNPMKWLMSLIAFATFIIFAIMSNRDDESFWRKRRNVFFGGIIVLLVFLLLPYLFKELLFVPLVTALSIAHLAHRRFTGIFTNNLRDLKALQAKILRHDAELRNNKSHAFDSKSEQMTEYSEPIETTA